MTRRIRDNGTGPRPAARGGPTIYDRPTSGTNASYIVGPPLAAGLLRARPPASVNASGVWPVACACYRTNRPGLLARRANKVAHGLHIGGVAGEGQAAKPPAALDRGKHRVVVVGHAR